MSELDNSKTSALANSIVIELNNDFLENTDNIQKIDSNTVKNFKSENSFNENQKPEVNSQNINLSNFKTTLNTYFSEKFENLRVKDSKFKMDDEIYKHLKHVNELKDDSIELPKFLSAARTCFDLIKPTSQEDIKKVINFLRQKLNSSIFLAFQDKEFASFEDFENELKSHYYKKTPSISFYMQIFNTKQKADESVNSYVNRLVSHKNVYLMQNDDDDLNLEKIMLQALINGLTGKLKLFAEFRKNVDFKELVAALKEQECSYSSSIAFNGINLANILLEQNDNQFQEEMMFATQNHNPLNSRHDQNGFNHNHQFQNWPQRYQNQQNPLNNFNQNDRRNYQNFKQNSQYRGDNFNHPQGYVARNQRYDKQNNFHNWNQNNSNKQNSRNNSQQNSRDFKNQQKIRYFQNQPNSGHFNNQNQQYKENSQKESRNDSKSNMQQKSTCDSCNCKAKN